MAQKNQDFEMFQGEDKVIDFYITDSSKVAIDLTGAKFEWLMTVSPTITLSKSTTNNNIIIKGSHAQVMIDLIDTINLNGVYSYKLKMTDINNKTQIVAIGKATVLKISSR